MGIGGNDPVDFADTALKPDCHFEDADQHDRADDDDKADDQEPEGPTFRWGSVTEAPTWARTQAVLNTCASRSGGVAEQASVRKPSSRCRRSGSS